MSLTELTQRETLKLTTLEYRVEDDGSFLSEPIIELFARDADGNRRRIEVEGFYPSFYITEDEYQEHEHDIFNESMVRSVTAQEFVTSAENIENAALTETDLAPRTTLDGRNLVKIETVKPGHVADLKDSGIFNSTWEADVFFTNRFLIDSGIKVGFSIPAGQTRVQYEDIEPVESAPQIQPRVCTIDIEVWSGGKFPDTQDPKKPITAVTIHDSYTDEYEAAVLHPDAVEQGQPHTWDEETVEALERDSVRVFENEAKMLAHFNKWIITHDPDLMTGWNSSRNEIGSGFDYPYWINRCKRINEWTIDDTSPTDTAFVTQRGAPVMGGREMFDMLQAYKKTQIHEKRSYALGYIAEEELGYGKEDVADLDEGWLHEPVEFMEYNVRDVEAVVEIEASKNVLDMYDHIRGIAGATYSEIADSNIGIIDILYLREAKARGLALPTSTRPDTQHYWGAYVFPPVAGKHKNVVYPDLKCFTPDHDVVTTDGVKNITDISVGDVVYSINPDTGAVERKPVTETYAYPEYDGEISEFSGTRVDFAVTPNHRMLYQDGDEYFFEEAGSYDGSRMVLPNASSGVDGSGIETFDLTEYLSEDSFDVRASYDCHGHTYRRKLPDGCTKKRANYHEGFFFDGKTFGEYKEEIENLSEDVSLSHPNGNGSTFRPYKFDGDAFIKFLGWFITEGSVYYPEDSNSAVVQIAQETYSDDVESVFDELGLSYSVTDGAYTIGSKIYGDFLTEYTGDNSFEKQIPRFIFEEASVHQKKLLLQTMMKGDGHGNIYYTSSTQLTDDVVRLAIECGKKPKMNRRRETEYEITITETNDAINEYMETSSTAFDGVYCIEVADNNTMMVGRNGKFQWCGNSLYPNLFRDMNASPETIIGFKEDLEASEYTESDCHTVYVDTRSEGVKRSADEPERTELFVLKPEVKESFVRDVIGDLIDMKYEYKSDEYADEAYAAVKRITNSVYGCMGDSVSYGVGFRLFDWRIAEAITLAGRDVIKHTADTFEDTVQKYGYEDAEIIAGDTDSCVCEVPSADGLDETLEVAQEAAEYVDSTYPDYMFNRFGIEQGNMAVEIESYAEAALFMHKKKRYAQWIRWDEGDLVDEVEVKGFELVRSDSSAITAEVQREVLTKILKQEDAKTTVGEYFKENWDSVMNGEVDPADIGKPSAINNGLYDYGWSKSTVEKGDQIDDINGNRLERGDEYVHFFTPQPHIRGARYANKHIDGEDLSEGSKPMMFYTNGVSLASGLSEVYDYTDQSLNAPSDLPYKNQSEMMELDREVDAVAVDDVSRLPDGILIDWEKMANKTLRDPIEPIVKVMGWDFDDLITEGTQSGLAQFM